MKLVSNSSLSIHRSNGLNYIFAICTNFVNFNNNVTYVCTKIGIRIKSNNNNNKARKRIKKKKQKSKTTTITK